MGGLYAIGDDGAAEAGENPAYLAVSRGLPKRSVHVRSAGFLSGNIVVTNQPIADVTQLQSAFDAALAWRALGGSKWAAGLAVGDVRQPTYQRLSLEGKSFAPATGFETTFQSSSVDQIHSIGAALAYRLSPKDSLGFRLRYTHRLVRDKENVVAPVSSTVVFSDELTSEQRGHQIQGTLSYLYHAGLGDFTIVAGNLGAQQIQGSFAYSTAISSANNVVATTQESAGFSNAGTLDPFFLIGFRRLLFGAHNVFVEGGAQPTVQQYFSDNFYRKDGSQKATVRRDIHREGGIAYEAGAGLGLRLSEDWTWHAGARYQTSSARVSSVAADNNSRYLDTTSVQFFQGTTGVSWRRSSYTWQLGASYQYQKADLEKRSSYTDTGVDKATSTQVNVAVNTYGFFFAFAADF